MAKMDVEIMYQKSQDQKRGEKNHSRAHERKVFSRLRENREIARGIITNEGNPGSHN